jgi:Transcriptional regulator PadR-like family
VRRADVGVARVNPPAVLASFARNSSHSALSLCRDCYGYGIMREVAWQSDGQYQLGPGTLYDNLQKLMNQGLAEEAPRHRRMMIQSGDITG